jgi:signal transduction histidine kinase
MNISQPAFQLLLVLCLSLVCGMPLIAWILMQGRGDLASHRWFVGLASNAVGIVSVAVLQSTSPISAVGVAMAVVLFMDSIRYELTGRTVGARVLVWFAICYGSVMAFIGYLGQWAFWGNVFHLVLLSLLEIGLLVLFVRLWLVTRSRGLVVLMLGLGCVGVSNLMRLMFMMSMSRSFEVFSWSTQANLTILLVVGADILFAVGYGAFILEKAHAQGLREEAAKARAEAQARVAEAHARELEAVVAQRNEMIMAGTRFSAVNSLAMYNAAIVHEVSQPLQGLTSMLDTLSLKAQTPGAIEEGDLSGARKLVTKMANTIGALRELILSQRPRLEPLCLDQVLDDILPILSAEGRRLGVPVHWHPGVVPAGRLVLADKVLLQRVLFNLVTNAFEAQAGPPSDQAAPPASAGVHVSPGPAVFVQTLTDRAHGAEYGILRVQDHGPGLSDEQLGLVNPPFLTDKARGLGLGLVLVRLIAQSWGGHLSLNNRPQQQGGGACIEIWIPLQA